MAIITSNRSGAVKPVTRRPAARQPITASSSITSGVRNRQASSAVMASFNALDPARKALVRQLQANGRKHSAVMGATNTSNIAARPDFLELLPMFVQKLIVLDLYGSVAMRSRQQLIPYFKFIAEATKGETERGTILSSPMVNRQGLDENFTGRVVKNEVLGADSGTFTSGEAVYTPILPGSVTLQVTEGGNTGRFTDDGTGVIFDGSGNQFAIINYSEGTLTLDTPFGMAPGDSVKLTYQYDNETVGPNANGEYGAKMAKGYLQLDEFNLIAEAHEIASYWSIFSAFAAQQEYGANIADISKEASLSELTAEINTKGFNKLKAAASYKPQFNWDASPVMSGSVVPSDYLNMFKLKLGQAAASIYQATRLSRPNRLTVGSNCAEYIAMINGFAADNIEDTVGPYKFGKLDQFEVYVEPSYNPNEWVMSCKSNDIRRNSGLFGEYMAMTNTDAIGLANASVQQGYATMYAMEVVNPDTVVSGKIIGTF